MSEHDLARAVSERMTACAPIKQDDQFFYQDVEGDFVEFFVRRDAYYAKYVDSRLVVYYCRTNNEVIGAKISGISRILEHAPGIRLELRDGKVRVCVLFMASMWTAETEIEEAVRVVYDTVRDMAKKFRRRVAIA